MQRFLSAMARLYVNYLPFWPGKFRLLRPFAGVLVSQVRPGVWLHVDTRFTVESTLLFKQPPYDQGELELLSEILQPGMTVVDVGAFIGLMSLVAAKRVGATGHIFAFEAGPPSVARLAANRDLCEVDNMTICAAAVGGGRGMIEYHYNVEAPDQSAVESTTTKGVRSMIVPTISLDEFLAEFAPSRIDVIKIDVEGAESSVLEGARATLIGSEAPLLLIEMNLDALKGMGSSAGQLTSAMLEHFSGC